LTFNERPVQKLLPPILQEVRLQPSTTAGEFRIVVNEWMDGDVIWDRKVDGGFPDLKELKARLRECQSRQQTWAA